MGDCDDVEIRELLPEYAAGALDAAARERVVGHLARCAPCRDELALLATARKILGRPVAVDSARIARAVVAATTRGAARGARAPSRTTSWPAIRIAASIALAAVGVATVGVWRRREAGSGGERPGVVANRAAPARAVATLAPVGSLAELDEDQLSTLLDDIVSLEAAPMEDPADIVPAFIDPTVEEIQ